MKKVLALFVIAFLLSCNSGNKEKKLPEENTTNLLISDFVDVMGSWTMCKIYDGETISLMNVCPTIIFNSNGTGHIKLSSPEVQEFSWTLKNNKLIIVNNIASTATFPDTAYSISFSNRKKSLDLTIANSNYVFYLSK